MNRYWLGRVLDLVTYAMAGAVLAFVAAGVVSFALGHGVPGIKLGLFYVGWLLFGYASIRLFPTSLHKTQSLPGGELKTSARLLLSGNSEEDEHMPTPTTKEAKRNFASTDETPFQRFVQKLPPARFVPLRKSQRFSMGTKTMALSLAILGTSIVMEFVFHVA
jgi:hypothetical protein